MKPLFLMAGRAAGAKLVPAFLIAFFCLSRPCAGQTYNGFSYSVSGTDITITGYTGLGGAVTIPSTIPGVSGMVTSTGINAFQGCSGLTSVTISGIVTSIGGGAFMDCSGLTAITVAAQNPAYASISGVLFNRSQTMLIAWPGGNGGDYTIPGSVTSIGLEAFHNCSGLT